MKLYQIYFFVLKALVFLRIVLLAAGSELAQSPAFVAIDGLFKLSLGLFLGIYFCLFTPKGVDFEDAIIISIGGFLILADIQFGPLIRFYEARDWTIKKAFSVLPKTDLPFSASKAA